MTSIISEIIQMQFTTVNQRDLHLELGVNTNNDVSNICISGGAALDLQAKISTHTVLVNLSSCEQ